MVDIDFPPDLRDAQLRLHQTRIAYEELCRTLPWSFEPAPGWEGDKQLHSDGRVGGMPDSPGYTDAEKSEEARLRNLLVDLSTTVMTHRSGVPVGSWHLGGASSWLVSRSEGVHSMA
ncbi:hypothetical protein [Streptomyces albipurpureus]|uniref:Transposase n=1 Tax=Streptomyces albipurpureus TaxID=2897419 RepID=A0ABT0UKM1_9ACTN|nr:hypothetical protein [Streptomyces sp. CWNU-1]MCM2388979.1 hypothetical protein [Streptomyces sp. CWNU-1]